jgi:hypothetical protein
VWLFSGHHHDERNTDEAIHHHGHHHGHGHSHSLHHDAIDQESPTTESNDDTSFGQDPDHDSDAVYVTEVFVIGKPFRWILDITSLPLILWATWSSLDALVGPVQAPHNLPPPFHDCSACPIYLQTLALLI